VSRHLAADGYAVTMVVRDAGSWRRCGEEIDIRFLRADLSVLVLELAERLTDPGDGPCGRPRRRRHLEGHQDDARDRSPALRARWEQIRQGVHTPPQTGADLIIWAATHPSLTDRTGLIVGPGHGSADAQANALTPALRTAVTSLTARTLAVALR
jgi:hypothetical protein